MPTKINTIPPTVQPVVCNFGWFYGVSPQRLAEASYVVGGVLYPPGVTVTTSSVTLPVATIPVSSTASFETSGTLTIRNPSARQTITYTGVTPTSFTGCVGGTGTYGSGSDVFDPRFYVDQAPLQQLITLDAIDSHNLGLPTTVAAPGYPIIDYRWDFGNGQLGYGPFASTTYTFNMATPSLQATLTVTDALGRHYSCAKRLNLLGFIPGHSTSVSTRQGSARP